jgi:hypothetical protein
MERNERQLVENLIKQDVKASEVIPQIKLLFRYLNNRTSEEKRKLLGGVKTDHLGMQKVLAKRLGISEWWLSELLTFDREADKKIIKVL